MPAPSIKSLLPRRSLRGRRGAVLTGLFVLLALAVARFEAPALFQGLSDQSFDLFQRISPRDYRDAPVRVVDIDDLSLEKIGQWPWSRDVMADLTRKLQDRGAAAIAFDVVFAEADRTSPHRIATQLVSQGRMSGDAASLPDNDKVFAAALARGRTVTGFALTAAANSAMPQVKTGIALLGEAPTSQLRHYPGATVNLPFIAAAASGNGNFAIAAADARTVRALPLLAVRGDAVVPSLALESLRVAQGAQTIAVRRTTGGSTASLEAVSPLTVRVGAIEIPLAADGSYPLHFTRDVPSRLVPAWKVLDETSDLAPDALAGRIVVVGSSAVGLADLRPTPLNPFEPGVAIHAAGLEQILLGQNLIRPIAAPLSEVVVALVAGLAVVFLVAYAPVGIATVAAAALFCSIAGAAFWLYAEKGLLVDPAPAMLAVAATFLSAVLARIVLSEREKSRLRHAFGHYLSPEMVKALAAHPERLKLGGETREMTFLFTDLEGFTAFTEHCEPQILVRVLNSYLAGMCRIVTGHGGTIDKIVGDAVHAMFNAPLDQPDHADRAVACALEILAFSRDFAEERAAEGLRIGTTRIGVNTGPAVVGNFGGAGRFDYTAHGDAINTAARLEAANKALGTTICIAGSTVAQATAHSFRPIGTLMLKGKVDGVEAYMPIAPAAAEPAGWREAFASLVDTAPRIGEAMRDFASKNPDDAIAQFHASRLSRNLSGHRIALA